MAGIGSIAGGTGGIDAGSSASSNAKFGDIGNKFGDFNFKSSGISNNTLIIGAGLVVAFFIFKEYNAKPKRKRRK